MIAPEEWRAAVTAAADDGFTYLDLLTAVDRDNSFEIVVRLLCAAEPDTDLWLHTAVDRSRPVLDSLVPVLPAASWHEREVHEMFGVDFIGHPDLRPLLLTGTVAYPLRKEAPLVARVETPWPGRSDSGRRSSLPPGVRSEWATQ